MVAEVQDTGLHLLCGVDLLFLVGKDLQAPLLGGLLLKTNGVLSLQYGVYLHLQLGEILQDTYEVLCSLLWEE